MHQQLSFDEAREMLQVSRSTLHRFLQSGVIRGSKVGGQWRFIEQDLRAYLERQQAGVTYTAAAGLDEELRFWDASGRFRPAAENGSPDDKALALANAILHRALEVAASAIHVEPGKAEGTIRFRIAGALETQRTLPGAVHRALCETFQGMAGLAEDARGWVKEGSFAWPWQGEERQVDAALLPVSGGELLTLTLRAGEESVPALQNLAGSDQNLHLLHQLLQKPHGLVAVTGPVGSGKTSVVYSLLAELVSEERSILVLEEGPGIPIKGTLKVSLNPARGMTAVQAVRASLHHDPDVIFLGALQEKEEAVALVQAALQGHQIFTTLPLGGAVAAASAFTHMAGAPLSTTSALGGLIGVRLVRCLCQECAVPQQPDAARLVAWQKLSVAGGLADLPAATWKVAVGCPRCRQTGYRGRRAVLEVLVVQGKIRDLLLAGAGPQALAEAAVRGGMVTMQAQAYALAAAGVTDVAELDRVFAKDGPVDGGK